MCAGSSGDVGAKHRDDEQSVGTGAVLVQVGARRRSVHVTQLKHLKTSGTFKSFPFQRRHKVNKLVFYTERTKQEVLALFMSSGLCTVISVSPGT